MGGLDFGHFGAKNVDKQVLPNAWEMMCFLIPSTCCFQKCQFTCFVVFWSFSGPTWQEGLTGEP